jgi:hypothetical protein
MYVQLFLHRVLLMFYRYLLWASFSRCAKPENNGLPFCVGLSTCSMSPLSLLSASRRLSAALHLEAEMARIVTELVALLDALESRTQKVIHFAGLALGPNQHVSDSKPSLSHVTSDLSSISAEFLKSLQEAAIENEQLISSASKIMGRMDRLTGWSSTLIRELTNDSTCCETCASSQTNAVALLTNHLGDDHVAQTPLPPHFLDDDNSSYIRLLSDIQSARDHDGASDTSSVQSLDV